MIGDEVLALSVAWAIASAGWIPLPSAQPSPGLADRPVEIAKSPSSKLPEQKASDAPATPKKGALLPAEFVLKEMPPAPAKGSLLPAEYVLKEVPPAPAKGSLIPAEFVVKTPVAPEIQTRKGRLIPPEVIVKDLSNPPLYLNEVVGQGALAEGAKSVLVHVLVVTDDDREFVNTRRRGLPYWFRLDQPEPVLGSLVKGMRVGGVRLAAVSAKDLNEGKGLNPIIPANVDFKLRIWLLDVR